MLLTYTRGSSIIDLNLWRRSGLEFIEGQGDSAPAVRNPIGRPAKSFKSTSFGGANVGYNYGLSPTVNPASIITSNSVFKTEPKLTSSVNETTVKQQKQEALKTISLSNDQKMIMPSNFKEANLISPKSEKVNETRPEFVKICEYVEDKIVKKVTKLNKRISKRKVGKLPGIPSINRLMSLRSAVKLNKIEKDNTDQTVVPVVPVIGKVKKHKIEQAVEQVPEIIKIGILNNKRNNDEIDKKLEEKSDRTSRDSIQNFNKDADKKIRPAN
ncbi:hypothetical protein OnM2_108025 [Erysiphe neolycopersici]|uniref:Uncharacterized protein n=1 Tax=Erysiphe neolycopersici TaxID=212602 RepID=A0A420H6P9_9PEZI|nr:hypothetical protein OnM2_108025 [Erysiphe neolycopersici]